MKDVRLTAVSQAKVEAKHLKEQYETEKENTDAARAVFGQFSYLKNRHFLLKKC